MMVSRPLQTGGRPRGTGRGRRAPATLILHPRSDRTRFLDTVRTGLAGALIVALLLATVLSYPVARTMTGRWRRSPRAMREVAATGDLTAPRRGARIASGTTRTRACWAARSTRSPNRSRAFQREEAQRERLSSLGRLSTVVAHEIRNPLMIIGASQRCAQGAAASDDVREAVADIDEETHRLNRLVTEVLDFAKPLRFDPRRGQPQRGVPESAAAAWAGDGPRHLTLIWTSSPRP